MELIKRRLTNEAVMRLTHPKNASIREKLSITLGVTVGSINRYLRANEWDGDLTKLSAMEVIAGELQMEWNAIFEREPLEAEVEK